MKRTYQLKGVVLSGRNKGKSDIGKNIDFIQKELECKIYPGTLNLVLDFPVELNTNSAFCFEQNNRMIWKLDYPDRNIKLFIYRWSGCPLHIIEIVSNRNLRNCFNLKDGDTLTLNISKSLINEIPLISSIIWGLLWRGRESWYYKFESYKNTIYKYPRIRQLASQRDLSKASF